MPKTPAILPLTFALRTCVPSVAMTMSPFSSDIHLQNVAAIFSTDAHPLPGGTHMANTWARYPPRRIFWISTSPSFAASSVPLTLFW
jgi:hypothetical protein